MLSVRTSAVLGGVPLALGVSILAPPASGHVGIGPDEVPAGSFTVATVSVPHGCEGSATTRLDIKIPEQILSVTPTRNPYWTVRKVMVRPDPPVTDGHGSEVSERVDRVVYTARQALPEGQRDVFELSFQVPDVAGETLLFPTVQTCEQGETAWVEEPTASGAEPEHPAPAMAVTAASETSEEVAPANAESGSTDDSEALAWVGIGLGVLGSALGAAALARGRRSAASA